MRVIGCIALFATSQTGSVKIEGYAQIMKYIDPSNLLKYWSSTGSNSPSSPTHESFADRVALIPECGKGGALVDDCEKLLAANAAIVGNLTSAQLAQHAAAVSGVRERQLASLREELLNTEVAGTGKRLVGFRTWTDYWKTWLPELGVFEKKRQNTSAGPPVAAPDPDPSIADTRRTSEPAWLESRRESTDPEIKASLSPAADVSLHEEPLVLGGPTDADAAPTSEPASLRDALGRLALAHIKRGLVPRRETPVDMGLRKNCLELHRGKTCAWLSPEVDFSIGGDTTKLRICACAIGDLYTQATVYRGELRKTGNLGEFFGPEKPHAVVAKIYEAGQGSGERKFERADIEIKNAKKLTELPRVVLPSLIEFIGVLEPSELDKLDMHRAYPHGGKGVIYAFIPGKSVYDLHKERRRHLEAAPSEESSNYAGSDDTSDFAGWASCVTYQMILAHLQTLSRGLLNDDAHRGNFLVDESHEFKLGESKCGFVKMIDLGIMREVEEAGIPEALARALLGVATPALSIFISEHKRRTLHMTRELIDLIAEISKLSTQIKESVLEKLKIRIREKIKLPETWPKTAAGADEQEELKNFWLYKLYEAITAEE